MSSTLTSAPVKLAAATSADVIAVAFAVNGAGSFSFEGPGTIISDIESCFDVDLVD